MSNSELFVVKDDQEGVEFHILKRPMIQFQDDHHKCSHAIASHDTDHDQPSIHHAAKDVDEEAKEDKCKASSTKEYDQIKPTTTLLLGDCKPADHIDDDDDGFRTPTSLDHKIPAIKQCPPAPRKPKQLSTKRKAMISPNVRLDLSTEVESLFPRPVLADLHKKIKKARREEDSTTD